MTSELLRLVGPGALSFVVGALELALKASVVLLLPLILERLRPLPSAAARHLAWFLALAAILVMPVLGALAPGWSLSGLAWRSTPVAKAATPSTPSMQSIARPASRSSAASRTIVGPVAPATHALDEVDLAPAPASSRAPAAREPSHGARPDLPLAPLAWAAGAMVVLARLVAARLSLRSLARSSRPLAGAGWTALVDEARRALSLGRPVELLRGPVDVLPMTWGLRRTRVLLPASADDWPEPRRRVVIRHELAHARRHDCLTQLVAQFACALYWFHPLVWYAARRMQVERERACDDLVLAAETRASDYAEHLVAVVRSLREARGLALGAVGFARRSEFEGRLLAVLDPNTNRRPLSAAIARWAGVLALVLIAPVATLRSAAPARADNGSDVPLLALNDVLLGSGPAPAGRLVGGTNDVRKAPEADDPLASRWKWATSEKAGDAQWIGWWAERGDESDGNLLSDSDGLWLGDLDGQWNGPSLEDLLLGRSPSRQRHERGTDRRIAFLFHRRGGTVDRVRAQSLALPAELGGQPLLWLGHAEAEPSIALLEQLMGQIPGAKSRGKLLELISFHSDHELVASKLEPRLAGREPEAVREQAAEGLGRQPTVRAVRALEKAMLEDASPRVRRRAAEALGELRHPLAGEVLTSAAKRPDVADDTKRKIYEALVEQATASGADALSELAQPADVPDPPDVPDVADAPEAADMPGEPVTAEQQRVLEKLTADAKRLGATDARVSEQLVRELARKAAIAGRGAESEDDRQTQLQADAVENFRRFEPDVARPRLREIAKHHAKPPVRERAVETLARFNDVDDIPVLEDIARSDASDEVAAMAAEALRCYPGDVAVAPLRRLVAPSVRADVRHRAMETLSRLDDGPGLPFFEQIIFSSHDEDDVNCALDALRRFPADKSAPVLERVARQHPSIDARRSALEVLTRIDPKRALPVMESLLREGGSK